MFSPGPKAYFHVFPTFVPTVPIPALIASAPARKPAKAVFRHAGQGFRFTPIARSDTPQIDFRDYKSVFRKVGNWLGKTIFAECAIFTNVIKTL